MHAEIDACFTINRFGSTRHEAVTSNDSRLQSICVSVDIYTYILIYLYIIHYIHNKYTYILFNIIHLILLFTVGTYLLF